jgi:hypothetical protein
LSFRLDAAVRATGPGYNGRIEKLLRNDPTAGYRQSLWRR